MDTQELKLEGKLDTTYREIPIVFSVIEEGKIKISPEICKLSLDFILIDAYGEITVKLNDEIKYYTQILTPYNTFICAMEYGEFKALYGDFINSLRQAQIDTIDNNNDNNNFYDNENI